MAKEEIEEFDDEFINKLNTSDDDDDDDDDDSDGGITLDDSDDDLDIIIEIDDDDIIDDVEDIDSDPDDTDDIILSKHKVEGKHSLKYDSIFKGKKEDPLTEEDGDSFIGNYKDTIEVDKSSQHHFESIENESYIKSKLVKEKVYEVLNKHTGINFLNNRRKPSRYDFNQYYALLSEHLRSENFTNIEIFNELAVYFSDNLFNMFKLLDNEWRNSIIIELQDHIGSNKNSKEITNRNIYEGTEVEFMWVDEFNEDKIITGVVLETDYMNSVYKIDSYENIYNIELHEITKILNNTKFKYNLNRLNNIDFL